MSIFCDRLKLGSTAALDCGIGQNKGRYRKKSAHSYSSRCKQGTSAQSSSRACKTDVNFKFLIMYHLNYYIHVILNPLFTNSKNIIKGQFTRGRLFMGNP